MTAPYFFADIYVCDSICCRKQFKLLILRTKRLCFKPFCFYQFCFFNQNINTVNDYCNRASNQKPIKIFNCFFYCRIAENINISHCENNSWVYYKRNQQGYKDLRLIAVFNAQKNTTRTADNNHRYIKSGTPFVHTQHLVGKIRTAKYGIYRCDSLISTKCDSIKAKQVINCEEKSFYSEHCFFYTNHLFVNLIVVK